MRSTRTAKGGETLESLVWRWGRTLHGWPRTRRSESQGHGAGSHHFLTDRWGNSANSDNSTLLGSKITVDYDCSHEIKRHLLLGRKAVTNLDSVLKRKDIALPTKVRLVKAVVFPVVMYGCESRTIKKAERQRTDAFELWRWRRLLRVPWTARRSNQLILKEINSEYHWND